ncbi:MAG TPA: acyl-CoA dehydrogenase family protein, partial [Gemmatimonadaceae bacterium]|nr:acyl-CoA dehydrogenase family protein [Gemmatimonadaceae bacterium]
MQTETSSSPSALTLLSEEEVMFRDAVAAFAEEEVRPRVMEMEKAGKIDPALLPKYFELGLMGIEVPEQYGGAAGTLFMVTLAVEEISKIDPAAAIVCDVQNTLVNYPITQYGTEAQKAKYLPLLTSEVIGAYALSESGSGSDAFGLATRAEKRGDRWLLRGQKLWITNGAEAGVFVVFANANPSAGYHGITAFIIERGFKGFSVGKKEDKLGIRASSTVELLLDDCEVPEENVLGPVGQGYKIAITTMNEGRIGIGAQMIGVAQGALNATIRYAGERKQFGKSLTEFQGVQFQLAQAATDVEAARLMVYNAARLKDAGKDIAR